MISKQDNAPLIASDCTHKFQQSVPIKTYQLVPWTKKKQENFHFIIFLHFFIFITNILALK